MSLPLLASLVLLAAIVAAWFLLPRRMYRLLIGFDHWRTGLESQTIEVDGYRWFYLSRPGSDPKAPRLLLLHGIGADADNWSRFVRALDGRFHIVAPDLLGFGRSECPQELSYSARAQAQRLGHFLAALNPTGEPWLVAGNSMGGLVAAALAQQQPRLVHALCLLAPGGVLSSKLSEPLSSVVAGAHNPLSIRNQADFEHLFSMCFSRRPWVPYPVRRQLARRAMRQRHHVAGVFAALRFDSDSMEWLAAQLRVPTLILWGEDDRILDPSGAIVLQRLIPGARRVMIEQSGHVLMAESPRQCAEAWLQFLASLEQDSNKQQVGQGQEPASDMQTRNA